MNIFPFDSIEILKKKKSLKRQLLGNESLIEKRIAILSGATIGDIKDILEIFLLSFGIKANFFIGQYNRFYEDVMFENQELINFNPELIYIHTSMRNLSDTVLMDKLQDVWRKISKDYSCSIIQNNFELTTHNILIDNKYINTLNNKIFDYAKEHKDFYISDIQLLSARYGLDSWLNQQDYFLYKYSFAVNAIPIFCYNIAKIIKSIYGKNQKCLVLDLDNTLWGGVVGDVGVTGIDLGMETAIGEAYINFQKYIKMLHDKGVILAVCSKNDEQIAREAFSNKNMILRLEDFTVFCANWNNKADNILKIANQLNILPESIVFIDDNPVERDNVKRFLPEVKVPEVDSIVDFINHIEDAGYFYIISVLDDDKKRNDYYFADAKRKVYKSNFIDYGEYLSSLQMYAEIKPFDSKYLDRITQLINKTNQFNLTTKRFSLSELEKFYADPNFITLYATLDDKFGSNGIVSILIGEIIDNNLHIRLWVMSCRVFKRDLELAIFDYLVKACLEKEIKKVVGYYFETPKNIYVKNLYDDLKFKKLSVDCWEFNVTREYKLQNKYIEIRKDLTK